MSGKRELVPLVMSIVVFFLINYLD